MTYFPASFFNSSGPGITVRLGNARLHENLKNPIACCPNEQQRDDVHAEKEEDEVAPSKIIREPITNGILGNRHFLERRYATRK